MTPSNLNVTGICTEPVIPFEFEVSITADISEAERLSISSLGPTIVTEMFFWVTSALYSLERPSTENLSTVKDFVDNPLKSSVTFAEVELLRFLQSVGISIPSDGNVFF